MPRRLTTDHQKRLHDRAANTARMVSAASGARKDHTGNAAVTVRIVTTVGRDARMEKAVLSEKDVANMATVITSRERSASHTARAVVLVKTALFQRDADSGVKEGLHADHARTHVLDSRQAAQEAVRAMVSAQE